MNAGHKLVNQCQTGDLLLIGASRKSPDVWTKVCLVDDGYVFHTVITDHGAQTIKQRLVDFLDHENKPIVALRLHENLILKESPELVDYVLSKLMPRKLWWNIFSTEVATNFNQKNSVDMNTLIKSLYNIQNLTDLETLGKFIRLL